MQPNLWFEEITNRLIFSLSVINWGCNCNAGASPPKARLLMRRAVEKTALYLFGGIALGNVLILYYEVNRWRGIDGTHRLIYKIESDTIEIIQCRAHYDD
jgi:hypothetical protein